MDVMEVLTAFGVIVAALGLVGTAYGLMQVKNQVELASNQIEQTQTQIEQTQTQIAQAQAQIEQIETQIEQSGRIAAGEFLLSIDQKLFDYHHDIHVKLRPGGEWASEKNRDAGPKTTAERAAVETYMGLFERVYWLISLGIIPEDLARRFYGYRVDNLVRNKWVCEEKLRKRAGGWEDFIALCETLDVEIPC